MSESNLWLRKWRILIADKDENARDVSDLRVVFNVRRARETDHFATVKIYNLNREDELWAIANADRLVIEAGYQGDGDKKQYGKIFDGKVIYPYRNRESNVDYVLCLLCVDGNNQLNLNHISKTMGKGLNQRQIINAACENAVVKIPNSSISDNLSEQKLPRGKILFGSPVDIVRDVASNNAATWWIEDGNLTVKKYSDPAEAEALVTSPTTGLIGFPQQTQFGCSWQMLLNPAVKLFSLIKLENSEMNEIESRPGSNMVMPIDQEWIYMVTDLTHIGDTYGNEWYTKCNGVSRNGRGAIIAVMANATQNPGGGR